MHTKRTYLGREVCDSAANCRRAPLTPTHLVAHATEHAVGSECTEIIELAVGANLNLHGAQAIVISCAALSVESNLILQARVETNSIQPHTEGISQHHLLCKTLERHTHVKPANIDKFVAT
jgi:hypothetical protein